MSGRLSRFLRLLILWADGSFGDTDVFVGGSVVEKIAIAFPCHAFNKNHIGDLPHLLPFFFWLKDRLVTAEDDFARVCVERLQSMKLWACVQRYPLTAG